jgi:hypothetical protein
MVNNQLKNINKKESLVRRKNKFEKKSITRSCWVALVMGRPGEPSLTVFFLLPVFNLTRIGPTTGLTCWADPGLITMHKSVCVCVYIHTHRFDIWIERCSLMNIFFIHFSLFNKPLFHLHGQVTITTTTTTTTTTTITTTNVNYFSFWFLYMCFFFINAFKMLIYNYFYGPRYITSLLWVNLG